MLNRLTDNLNFQTQALTLRAERQRLLASNIANADTPGFQAREIDFARALREATGEVGTPGAMATTQRGHIAPLAGARFVSSGSVPVAEKLTVSGAMPPLRETATEALELVSGLADRSFTS